MDPGMDAIENASDERVSITMGYTEDDDDDDDGVVESDGFWVEFLSSRA